MKFNISSSVNKRERFYNHKNSEKICIDIHCDEQNLEEKKKPEQLTCFITQKRMDMLSVLFREK